MASLVPKKIELKPKRHHGYAVFLFIMGTVFPPLAVAARFGIGKDFWLNLLLTICGYIPGHVHNFYIQNIRNNKTHARTPKWAQRYGLIDTSEIKRKERKSQWATRYNDRLPASTLEGQPYEEGQEQGSSIDLSSEAPNGRPQRQPNGDLWRPEDEHYYNPDKASVSSSSGRWRYPANFDDVEPISTAKKSKKKKEKKDRWERTQDAYSMSAEGDGQKKKKKKKRKSSDAASSIGTHESNDYPEDPEGGLYGGNPAGPGDSAPKDNTKSAGEEVFNHEF
ncbi:hypothetical protein GALMADRAFT_89750 [Galerina marginata CBS 339.88]|uniref:Stress response RCI peptide n=1 Tax=Galerina marginata (strain CBS 339.88) TaxID=685588 RepID=A0A067TNX1_GALM3|nr:hypothetical protein GALMADRAFT_89750 [Galerina marginata CBS 339.88]